jgi:hypothetical protein
MPGLSGRNRDRRPARGARDRKRKPRLLIVCEGRNTEPPYFKQFANFHRNLLVEVEVAGGQGVPFTVVRAAKEMIKRAAAAARRDSDVNWKYEWVWCVFDIDEHPNISDARIMAKKNGIGLAISNPCFELWLLLHFQHFASTLCRHRVQALLKSHVQGYDKHINFEDYSSGYQAAVERAKALQALAESMSDLGRNPSTGVYELTEAIISPPQQDDNEPAASCPDD